MREWQIATEHDTHRLAQQLAGILSGGESVGLSGGLGAGKTTLVRYLIAALGGDERQVASPTYTLAHEYRLSDGRQIEHWDLYRVSSLPGELYEPPGSNTIRIIEWPERCPEIAAELGLLIRISIVDEERRTTTFDGVHAELLYARL